MSDAEKLNIYELGVTSLFQAIQERYNELIEADGNLSEFEQGRQLAYFEVVDIIKNRYDFILDLLDE